MKKLRVTKSFCPYCDEPFSHQWQVTDYRGHVLYMTNTWRWAYDYAYAATQPGTGDQVQNSE